MIENRSLTGFGFFFACTTHQWLHQGS